MKHLDENWFLTGLIDLEYKKYVLLDYIQHAKKNFKDNNLYPIFSSLISHYRNLVEYKDSLYRINNAFPKKLVGVDFENQSTIYEPVFENEIKELDIIDEIVDYSIGEIKRVIDEGKIIYEFVESKIDFRIVGMESLRKDEGYILVRVNKEVHAYRYYISQIKGVNDKYRNLNLEFVSKHKSTLTNTVDKIKTKLIEKHKDLPNPATYFVDMDLPFPLDQTILPIVKRKFLSDINF